MKAVTVSGPPSSGKTSIIIHMAQALMRRNLRPAVVKFDCLSASENEIYDDAGIPSIVGLSANMCPDHFYVSNIERGLKWAYGKNADAVFIESAGLCNRCSPHIRNIPAFCVVDSLSGSRTPSKIGPMLRLADTIVITKGDIISQAEREVFAHETAIANPQASVVFANGITGQGVFALMGAFDSMPELDPETQLRLRFTMPSALCSYCMGQTRIGKDFQMGAVREMEIEKL